MVKATKARADERPATMRLWLARLATVADYYTGRRASVFAGVCKRSGLRRLPRGPLTERDFEKLRRFEGEAERDALRRDRRCA